MRSSRDMSVNTVIFPLICRGNARQLVSLKEVKPNKQDIFVSDNFFPSLFCVCFCELFTPFGWIL